MDRALINLAYFLGVELSVDTLKCALRNREGNFHRHKDIDPYEGLEVDLDEINKNRAKLRGLIKQCILGKTCGTSGCAFVEF